MFGFDFSTGVSTSPPRAVAILTRAHFHKVSRAAGPQQTGMKHTQEADLGAEMLCVRRDLQQSGGTGAEQEVVDDLLVLESQPREFMRNGEDHMEVADGE